MNDNQYLVRKFMQQIPAQEKSVRDTPEMPPLNERILSARLMLEECMETIQKGLAIDIVLKNESTVDALEDHVIEFEHLTFVESSRKPSMRELADGLADQEVVNNGTGVRAGVPIALFYNEVMHNNFQKLQTGTIDEFGKLVKAKDHPAPRIDMLLDSIGYKEE